MECIIDVANRLIDLAKLNEITRSDVSVSLYNNEDYFCISMEMNDRGKRLCNDKSFLWRGLDSIIDLDDFFVDQIKKMESDLTGRQE